ncbi:sensor histidine kinase [Bacillus inaquosorum]|uniref:sensor histidine kinase n=1 Tax=Bacillus inaquosorum TaxID=483913 RepID=UPI00227F792C|nr:sensor histidine kinase [Bacillus inaquosorum]MCY8855548.1 sensor histidine kinase [Bacillus inaquosorum]MCY9010804.1 sensor histidine kinase [Bacillus inaquosorum]MCY9030757.1 sensor histidine kinase [Bacillus inaquosorum]MCY9036532.1 sensor histidine kinase [Bacillus inaquosorum]MCY9045865.1 sensor histidine kinase [Bacillus inaquosorum]
MNFKENDMVKNELPIKNPYNRYTYKSAKIPILIWLVITYSLTLFLQNYRIPLIYKSVTFTLVLFLFGLFVWYQSKIFKHEWLYFLVQGVLISFCFYLMPDAYPVVTIALYSLLVAQGVGIYYDNKKVFLVGVYVYVLFCLNVMFFGKGKNLLVLVAIMAPIMFCVVGYAKIFYHQIHARMRTQAYLEQLEIAYQKVEELTVTNERQRMARDLHDTLAQGLAGLSMQLEVIKANLNDAQYEQAESIVNKAAHQVRTTLYEARRVIDHLRSYESFTDFQIRIEQEVRKFTKATGIKCKNEMNINVVVPTLIREHLLRILNESLANIAKHSEAQHVRIYLKSTFDHTLHFQVRDDGIGFEVSEVERKKGHYGLLGIKERVKILNGKIEIQSAPSEGTVISIQIPLKGGKNDKENNFNRG